MTEVLHAQVFADAKAIAEIRGITRTVARILGLGKLERTRLATAVSEAARFTLEVAGGHGRVSLVIEEGPPALLRASVRVPKAAGAVQNDLSVEAATSLSGPGELVDSLDVVESGGNLVVDLDVSLPPSALSGGDVPAVAAHVRERLARLQPGDPHAEGRREQRELLAALEHQARAEAALRASEIRLRMAVNAADLGFLDIEAATGEVFVSERAVALLRVPERATIDQISRAFAACEREALHRLLVEPREGGFVEMTARTVGPEAGWLALRARDIPFGSETRRVVALRDVTAVHLQEQESRRLYEIEKQLMGIVSHDLRNPISAALMNAQILGRSSLDQRQDAALKSLTRALRRSLRMVGDLLDFTRVRVGSGIPIKRSTCDLHALANEAANATTAAHPGRDVNMRAIGAATGSWDSDRVEQVIINLLENAIAYSPRDSVVEVVVDGRAEEVMVSVQNAGEPIPAELCQRMFEPLVRGRDRTSGNRSIGLGLFIVRHIVEQHGGRVEVASTLEDGTTVQIHLPRTPARPDNP